MRTPVFAGYADRRLVAVASSPSYLRDAMDGIAVAVAIAS
jgi:hypothetical protein